MDGGRIKGGLREGKRRRNAMIKCSPRKPDADEERVLKAEKEVCTTA